MANPGDTSDDEALHDPDFDELHHVAAPLPRSESSKRLRGRSELKRIKSGGTMPKVAGPQHKLLRGGHHHHHHQHHSTSPHSHHRKSVKGAKQKAILKARAFKDLDMTIELLGIDSTKHAVSLLAGASLNPALADKFYHTTSVSGGVTGASPGWATPPASTAYTPTAAAARSGVGLTSATSAALTSASSGGSGGGVLSRSSSAGGAAAGFQRSNSINAVLPPGRMALTAGDAEQVPIAAHPVEQLLPSVPEVSPLAPQQQPEQAQPQVQGQQQQEQQQGDRQQQSWVAAVKACGGRKHRHNRSRSASSAEMDSKQSQQQVKQPSQQQQRQGIQPKPPSQQQQQQQRQVQFASRPPGVPAPWYPPPPPPAPARPSAAAAAAAQHSVGYQHHPQQATAVTSPFGSPFSSPAQQPPPNRLSDSSSADGGDRHPQHQQRGFQQGPALPRRGSSGSSSVQGLPPPPPPPPGHIRPSFLTAHMAANSNSSSSGGGGGTGTHMQHAQAGRGSQHPAAAAATTAPSRLPASLPVTHEHPPRGQLLPAGSARSKSAKAVLQSRSAASHSSSGAAPGSDDAGVPAGQQESGGTDAAGFSTASAPGDRPQQPLAHHLSLLKRPQGSPFLRRRAGSDGHSSPAAAGAAAGNPAGSSLPPQHVPDKVSLEKLQHDRAQWRSALHDVLEGQASLSPEEIDASLAESSARGVDLQAEVAGLIAAARAASSWKEREQCLGWVEDGYKRAKSITKELRSHLSLVESQGRSAAYNNIIRTLTPAVTGLAVAVADNLAAALAPMVAQHLLPANGGYTAESQQDCVGPSGAVQRGIAAAVAAAAADGGHGNGAGGAVLPGGDDECRLAFRIVRRWLEVCKEMRDRCRTNAQQVSAVQGCCNQAIDDLHGGVLRLMGATVSATAYLQASLLTHQHLSGGSFVHKVNNNSRLLILMWRYCHEMCAKVWRNFEALRHTALFMLLELLAAAANSATNMQRTAAAAAAASQTAASTASNGSSRRPLRRSGSGSSSSDVGSMPRASSSSSLGSRSAAARSALGDVSDESASDDELTAVLTGSSVWGSTPANQGLAGRALGVSGFSGLRGTGGRVLPTATDEDVQAQAWLPQVLLGLLHWSSVTARQVCEELDSAEQYSDAGLPSLASEVEEELAAALEDLQEAFFYLALTNTRRVARLASSPEGLACWALEILKDAAEGALKFVQDYDTSALGLGQVLETSGSHHQGERLFKSLKRSTDAVINGLLRVKRLLKIRRTDAEASTPAPAAGQPVQRQQSRRCLQIATGPQQQPAQRDAQQQGIAQLMQQQREQEQQQKLERVLSFSVDVTPSEKQQQPEGGSNKSAAGIAAAAGTGPGRPLNKGMKIASNSSSSSHKRAASPELVVALGGSVTSTTASSPLVSHMPLGYSPPGSLTAAAHAHTGGLGYSPPEGLTAAAAHGATLTAAGMPLLMTSPTASPAREGSPPLAILGTTPSAKTTSNRASRSLPLLLDIVSNGGSSVTAEGLAAAAAAGAAAAEKWAGWGGSMSGSGRFPKRPLIQQQQQQSSAGGTDIGLLESPPAFKVVEAQAASEKPQAVFSPFGAAAESDSPFSPAPSTLKPQQPSPWAGFSVRVVEVDNRKTQQQQPVKQQHNKQQQQQQQDDELAAPDRSGGSFVGRSRSFKDVLTNPAGLSPSASVAAGSIAPGSDRGSGPATPVYVTSPFGPAAQQQPQQLQVGHVTSNNGSTGHAPDMIAILEAVPAEHGNFEHKASPALAGSCDTCGAVTDPKQQQLQQRPNQQHQQLLQQLEVLPRGSEGADPSDVALAAKLFSSSSQLSSRDRCSTLPSSRLSSSIMSSSEQMGVEVFSSAAAAGSSDVDDIAAAADALADASGSGGRVTASQVVLPAALAILRMIQVSDDEFWKIRWCDLEPGLLRKLGNGSYGQVFQGVYLNAQVAIKVLNVDYDDPAGLSAETLLRFKAEVDFQRKLSYHPNVVRFIGACCELPAGLADALAEAAAGDQQQRGGLVGKRFIVPPGLARGVKLAIVMELCHLGSLYSMIGQARRVRFSLSDGQPAADLRRAYPYGFQFQSDWLTRLEVVRGAAAGLEYMHQHGVIHRDLTSYNLLLDFGKPWQVKVCDFNLSRMVAQQQQLTNSGNPNSPGWQSPEMLSGQPYGKAADVFSFGVVLWEVITLREPWREETEGRTALYYIMNAVTAGDRLVLPEPQCLVDQGLGLDQAVDLIHLTASCWSQLPVERPTMAEVAAKLGEIAKAVRDGRRAAATGGGKPAGAGTGR